MKKLLLSFSFIFVLTGANAQILASDNFSAYTLGDVGTDVTGTTSGQGGWYTYAAADVTNDDFQFVTDDADHGTVLQLTGSSTALNSRLMFQDGLTDAWTARDAGNDILEIEFDLYTGPATASKNNARMVIYNADGTQVLAGLSMAEDTKIISGVAYYDNTAAPGGTVANYLFNLGTTPVTFPADTWVRVGMSFNYNTGDVTWKGPGFNGYVTGASSFTDPSETDIVLTSGTGNTVSSVAKFDNYQSKASFEDTLLGVAQHATVADVFSVYPNPASNVINVSNTKNVNAISITDMNGRVVKQNVFPSASTTVQVDISDLASGVYVMNVTSDEGSSTQKIVKQ